MAWTSTPVQLATAQDVRDSASAEHSALLHQTRPPNEILAEEAITYNMTTHPNAYQMLITDDWLTLMQTDIWSKK